MQHKAVLPSLHFALAGILALFFWGEAAWAQDWSGGARDADQAEQEQERDGDHFILGVGTAIAPDYQGADKYSAQPIPVIDVKWGPFFANLRNGVGMDIIDTRVVTVGASITYLPGYSRKEAPDGIGKLSLGAGARGFVSLNAGGFLATVGGTKGIAGGNRGVVVDASLSYPITVTPRFSLTPTVGTTWTDKKYNRRYFGVDAEQSLASGLPAFRPGSGFKDVSALLTARYRLTDHIIFGVSSGVTTLLGDVKDSPIVVHKTQPMGILSLSYRFGS